MFTTLKLRYYGKATKLEKNLTLYFTINVQLSSEKAIKICAFFLVVLTFTK